MVDNEASAGLKDYSPFFTITAESSESMATTSQTSSGALNRRARP